MPDTNLHRGYDYTTHSTQRPTEQQPGDRLDADFDSLYAAVDSLAATIARLAAPRLVTTADLAPGVQDQITQTVAQGVTLLLAQVQAAAANAISQADRANQEATRAAQASQEARASSAAVLDEGAGVRRALLEVGARSTAAEDEARDAQNAANDAEDAANRARQDQELAGAWAEYLQGGNPIPPDFFAGTAITGNHWSARWWAAEAASAFGSLASLYCGALPSPPSNTLTGHPLPIGAIYYDTTSQQPYVWDGDSWNQFYAPVKATQLTLLYKATAGQTQFNLNTPDLNGQHYTVSITTPEPLDAYLNGVRLPRDAPVDGTGDWDFVPATNVLTFLKPLPANSLVQIDVLKP